MTMMMTIALTLRMPISKSLTVIIILPMLITEASIFTIKIYLKFNHDSDHNN